MNRIITTSRIIYRTFLFILTVIIGSLFTILIQRSTMPTAGLSSRITRRFHKTLTNILGIHVSISGAPNKEATLFISNHITWLDILVIGQIIPTHFLSMIEVKSWPVAGWLATKAGTLYIHRGGKKSADLSINEISQVLSKKQNVVIFPEGRTTDGHLRKFHSRLLQSAIDANAQIQPIAIEYPNGDAILTNPAVLFTGDVTVSQSLLSVMSEKKINVEVSFLESFTTDRQTRSEVTTHAENQIRKNLNQL